MKSQEEDELMAMFQGISNCEDRQMILSLVRCMSARQTPKQPLLRLIVGSAILPNDSDLRGMVR